MLTRIFPSTPSIERFPNFPFHPPEACCAPLQMSALFIYLFHGFLYLLSKKKKGLSDKYCRLASSRLFYLACSVSLEFSPRLAQSIVIPDSPLGSPSMENLGIRWSERWRCIAGNWADDSTAAPPLPPAAMSQTARLQKTVLLFSPAKNIFKTDLPPCSCTFPRHQKRLKVVFSPIQ